MKQLERRIEKIEGLMGDQPNHTMLTDLAATRRRCEMLLSVAGTSGERADLLQTIQALDAGTFELPEPLPTAWDKRAAEVRRRMLSHFG